MARPPASVAIAPTTRPQRRTSSSAWRAALLAAAAACVLGLVAACSGARSSEPGTAAPLGSGAIDEDAAVTSTDWPFRPSAMRIHPLSRLVMAGESSSRLIEARLEFTDAWNDGCKALGEIQIDLHDDDAPGLDPVQRWYVDLRELATNADHYEAVTRTYVFRLESQRELTDLDPRLRAYYLGTEGTQLQAQLLLQRP